MSYRGLLAFVLFALASSGAPLSAAADRGPERTAPVESASARTSGCVKLTSRIEAYRRRSGGRYGDRLSRAATDQRRLAAAEREAAELGCAPVAAVAARN